jgi:hypothetical protein
METVLDGFRQFLHDYQHQLHRGVGTFWSDNGSEFSNKDMEQFCREMCVVRNFSIPYESRGNPYAERAWRTLLRPTRICLAESGTPDRFWPDFIRHAAHVHNVLVNDDCISPHERVHGERYGDYDKLHAIGCLCYYLLPARDRASKLSPRALPAIYLGPDRIRQGHKVYVPGLRRYTSAYHVVFNEHRFYDTALDRSNVTFSDPVRKRTWSRTSQSNDDHYREDRDDDDTADDQTGPDDRTLPDADDDSQPSLSTDHGSVSTRETRGEWNENHCEDSRCLYPRGHDGPHSHMRTYSRLRPRPLQSVYPQCTTDGCIYHDEHCGVCADDDGEYLLDKYESIAQVLPNHDDTDSFMDEYIHIITDDVQNQSVYVHSADLNHIAPKTYEDTQSSPLRNKWNESMLSEYTALLKNGTFEFVSRSDPRVRGRRPTKSRWVYTIKLNRDGTIERFKSRFVVCGYSQKQGIDYDRTFSATLRATSFRTLLAIAAGTKMRLIQFDVSNAFVQAKMDDAQVFIEPPKGHEVWETINGKRVSKLLLLVRALYGTKQASRLWQETLRQYLVEEVGFKCSKSDPCLYRLTRGNEEILLGVYVDDILVAYRGDNLYREFSSNFFKRFPGKSGPLNWFLGMAIDQHDDFSIHIDHKLSIEKMAEKFIPNNKITREFPGLDLFSKLDRAQNDVERAIAQNTPYASLVGALLYVSVMSRPDVAVHTSLLAKFLSDPSSECCEAAVMLLQYLYSTRDKRMGFTGKIEIPAGLEVHKSDILNNHGFVAYTDSSWGNKYPYPMFGYGIYLYGGLISFASKQLKTVAFSSCEAEYAAASFACKEIEFVRNICDDMGVTLHGRLVLAVDNTAAIDIAHDVGVSGRTKHFDRAIHYLRDLTQARRVVPAFVNTRDQRADGYTKPLDKSTFLQWIKCVIS